MSATKILLAEDDTKFRREVGLFLGKHGYDVICVEDGYQALEYAVREQPDLLILDVNMPAGSGFSVHERVMALPEIALKPVIYMTHDPSHRVKEIADEHGGYTLLHKPFGLKKLLEAVHGAMAAAGRAADAA